MSEPSRYMPPNSASPLACWSYKSDDEELSVEVIDPEASPNRDAPSGVAEHTAPITLITEWQEYHKRYTTAVVKRFRLGPPRGF